MNERSALYIGVMYEGPWERLLTWLYAIDRKTLELRTEVREGSLREKLADFCDRRDRAWKTRWAARAPRNPPARWKRHLRGRP